MRYKLSLSSKADGFTGSRPCPFHRLLVTAILLVGAAVVPGHAAMPCGAGFTAVGSVATGNTPQVIATGDFNRDGFIDFAVAIAGSNSFSIMLGNGSGSFQNHATYTFGVFTNFVAAADLNRDGKLDLIVTSEYQNGVFLGAGDGTFSQSASLPTGQGARTPVVADFNRDGKPDIALAVYTGGAISLFIGNGNGTFQTATSYANPYTTRIVLGDYNRDGNADLISIRALDENVTVWLGNGAGTLQAAATYPESISYTDAITADFNNDSRLDLALTRSGDTFIRLGNGDGTFQAAVHQPNAGLARIVAADFNADGFLDLLSALETSLRLSLGNGDGTFRGGIQFPAALSYPGHIAVDDLNRDGRPDVLVSNFNSNSISVFLGFNGATSGGSFRASVPYATGSRPGGGPNGVAIADFDRDGIPDIAVAATQSNRIDLLRGAGNGTFLAPASFATLAGPFAVAVGDVNRDGKLDLAVANASTYSTSVLLGNGDATFQPAVHYASPTTAGSPMAVVLGDFNGDGFVDMASGNTLSSVSLFLNQGNGAFTAPIILSTGGYVRSMTTGDLNRDGKLDIVTANVDSASFSVLLGDGNGAFQPATVIPAAQGLVSIAVADFNGDGKPDVATANLNANSLSVFFGNGDGAFQPRIDTSGFGPWGLTTGDLNGDGKTDLAVASNEYVYSLAVLLGRGDGTFMPGVKYSVGNDPKGAAIADLNGDGRLDIVVANFQSHNVSVLLQNAPFASAAMLSSAPNPSTLGQLVTLTANLSASLPSCNTPTGTVTFLDGTTAIATAALNASGVASVSTSALAAGTHSISVTYAGDRDFAASSSPAISQSVVIPPSTTTLSASDTAVLVGQGVTLTAQVSSPGATPGGTITFKNGTATIGTVSLSGASATLITSFAQVGAYSITALYSGDALHLGSTSAPLAITVNPRASTTSLYSSHYSAPAARQLTLVTSITGYAPTGTVTFMEGASTLGTAVLNGYGWAGIGISNLAQGTHSITAVYSGDSRNLGSTSAPVSIVISAPDSTCATSFANPASYGTGLYAYSVAIGDFNLDGRPDLVVANTGAHTVSVLLATANGLQPAVNYPVQSGPRSVAVGDLNGDGRPDLVTANSATFNVMLGAVGGFSSATVVSLAGDPTPNNIVLADVNRDGKLDLIATAGANISVRMGAGDGTFQSRLTYAAGASQAAGLAAADFNGDGAVDIAAGDAMGTMVRVLFNDGAGAFPQAVGYDAGSGPGIGVGPRGLAAADFNGDGKLDLAVLNHNNHAILLGTGGGHPNAFAAPATYPIWNLSNPGSIVAADFTGDGHPDFAVTYLNSHHVALWRGNGAGSFQNASQYSAGVQPMGLAAADLNGDGKLDLAVANIMSQDVSVLLATGGIASTTTTLASAPNPSVFGSSVTLTASVAAAAGCAAPAGTVTFKDGATVLGSAPLTGGQASLSISALTAGSHALSAAYSGDAWSSASMSATVQHTVDKAPQLITFNALPPRTFGDPGFDISTTASSGLAVTLSAAGNCTIVASTVAITGAGSCSITASQAGNVNFEPAPGVTQEFPIAKASTTTTLSFSPATITRPGNTYWTTTVSPATATGIIQLLRDDNVLFGTGTLSGGTLSLNMTPAAGTHNLTAVYQGDQNHASSTSPVVVLTVHKGTQTISFGALPARTYGDPPFTVSATGGQSFQPVTFTAGGNCTVSGNTVTITGAGNCSITASQAGNADWLPAPDVTQSFNIAKAAATMSFVPDSLNQLYDGTPRVVLVATSPAGLSGAVVTYDGQLAAPVTPGSYAVAATLTNANYAATPIAGLLIVSAPVTTTSGGGTTATSTVGGSTITSSFSNVTSGGTVTVTPIPPLDAASTPGGFVISGANLAFDISTTATTHGVIVNCFNVPAVSSESEFNDLRVLHREVIKINPLTYGLVDVTILNGQYAPSYLTHTICARTTSLSPFYLVKVVDRTPPAVTDVALSSNPAPVGTPVTLTARIIDSGDPASKISLAEYSLDGGANWTPVAADYHASTSMDVSVQLTPPAGVHSVCVRGSDGAQNQTVTCGPLLAVYDSSAGFVTGGGWILSPPGAFAPDPALTGKASFGFVAKYQNGAQTPSGDTQFQFQVANLKFKSTVYEWLVIAGARAQFKGSGTINGLGDYRFLLTAIDGEVSGGGGVDRFRIKIWDKDSGGVIYDNQPGKPDAGDDATALGGGSIIIHKP